uniref:Ig-like domain-containing protein n=1 Tax=Canis lupus familiaris TaxID=9615 RepID=A0A8I3PC17_CANLF
LVLVSFPLTILSVSAGSLSQPVLTQPPSLSASLGSTARPTCTLSSGFSVGSYHILWFQQKSESPPRYLLRFYSDSNEHQGPGVPSRFSGSKDTSTYAGLLLISGLQPEDEADYYCPRSRLHISCTTTQTQMSTRGSLISGLQAEDKTDLYCLIQNNNVSHSDTGR